MKLRKLSPAGDSQLLTGRPSGYGIHGVRTAASLCGSWSLTVNTPIKSVLLWTYASHFLALSFQCGTLTVMESRNGPAMHLVLRECDCARLGEGS